MEILDAAQQIGRTRNREKRSHSKTGTNHNKKERREIRRKPQSRAKIQLRRRRRKKKKKKEEKEEKMLNAELAMKEAVDSKSTPEKQVEYLVHIDIDELFYTGENSVIPHFTWLRDQGIDHMVYEKGQWITYANHEGVPEAESIRNYFTENKYNNKVSLFRKNHLTLGIHPRTREAMSFWTKRTRHHQYLLFYDNGITQYILHCIVVTSVRNHFSYFLKFLCDCWCCGFVVLLQASSSTITVNKPRSSGKTLCQHSRIGHQSDHEKEDGDNNDDDDYGDDDGNSNDIGIDPHPEEKPLKVRIQPSFHLDARDAWIRNKEKGLQKLFRSQVLLINNTKEVERQVESGVCMRLTINFNGKKKCFKSVANIRNKNGGNKVDKVFDATKDHVNVVSSSVELERGTQHLFKASPITHVSTSREESSDCKKEREINSRNLDKAWLLSHIAKKFLAPK
eukprot:jgi/Bigna1/91042/estExt_fgenesh1_pg.C_860063